MRSSQLPGPSVTVVLDETDAPLMLISAGIGSTPILGMLHYLTHTGTARTTPGATLEVFGPDSGLGSD